MINEMNRDFRHIDTEMSHIEDISFQDVMNQVNKCLRPIDADRFKNMEEILKGIWSGQLQHNQSDFFSYSKDCGSSCCIAGWKLLLDKEIEQQELYSNQTLNKIIDNISLKQKEEIQELSNHKYSNGGDTKYRILQKYNRNFIKQFSPAMINAYCSNPWDYAQVKWDLTNTEANLLLASSADIYQHIFLLQYLRQNNRITRFINFDKYRFDELIKMDTPIYYNYEFPKQYKNTPWLLPPKKNLFVKYCLDELKNNRNYELGYEDLLKSLDSFVKTYVHEKYLIKSKG